MASATIRIDQIYKDKLRDLAKSHKRSQAKELECIIDLALLEKSNNNEVEAA